MAVFRADADKFYLSEQYLIHGSDILEEKSTNITECNSSSPRGYEYKTEVSEICSSITKVIDDLRSLRRDVSHTKEKMINMMSAWASKYYETAANNHSSFENYFGIGEEEYVKHISAQYDKAQYNLPIHKPFYN